jgi:glyceraldehyde 3-phosphate dehydrogenase
MRVAINGFGRIGRSVFRVITQRNSAIEIAAINDLASEEMEAYLLKYDTVMGEFPGPVEVVDSHLLAAGQRVRCREGSSSTPLGRARDRRRHRGHRRVPGSGQGVAPTAGAKRDLTVPPRRPRCHDRARRQRCRLPPACDCLQHLCHQLPRGCEVPTTTLGSRVMTAVHAYTNDQRLADVAHKDFRRSRAATMNIIPTTTGAARAVGKVLPQLKGKLDGMAMRVPVPDGSTVDLVVEVSRPTTVEEVNAAMKAAAAGPMARIIEYSEAPLVSSDVIGNPHSSIFDAASTRVLGGNTVMSAWYDNEWVIELGVNLSSSGALPTDPIAGNQSEPRALLPDHRGGHVATRSTDAHIEPGIHRRPVLVVAAWGDDAATTTTTAAATTTTTTTTAGATTTTAGAGGATVSIISFAFQPNTVEIALGETITFTVASGSHTTTSTGNWDSGGLGEGESFSFTPTTAGTYEFFCSFHASMTGTLTVTG